MKHWISNSITGVALLAVAAVIVLPATAQTRTLKADVSFAFLTGNQVLPAGTYLVDVDMLFNRITMRSADGQTAGFLLPAIRTFPGEIAQNGVLVFARYDQDYFLRKVNLAGPAVGYEWVPSKAEKAVSGKAPVRVAMVRIALL